MRLLKNMVGLDPISKRNVVSNKWILSGPVVRITPTLLLVSDHEKLPEVYHRNADKTGHYITGSFGETESLFNMRSHKTHAVFRKHVAGPVWRHTSSFAIIKS
jgi:hypothetical protein